MSKYLIIEEVADLLRMSVKGVRKLVTDGKLTTYKVGKRLLFDESDLKAYLEKSCRKSSYQMAEDASNILKRKHA